MKREERRGGWIEEESAGREVTKEDEELRSGEEKREGRGKGVEERRAKRRK